MSITIRYYAALAEHANKTEEKLDTEIQDLPALYTLLKNKYKFPYDFSTIRTAVNASYVEKSTTIKDGDTVVFISPVAGG